VIRFARNVHFQIKDGKNQDLVKVMSSELLPLLKKQDGFRDEVMLLDGRHGVAISMWEDRKTLDRYSATVYPDLVSKLTPFIDGAPKVETFEVPLTTLSH